MEDFEKQCFEDFLEKVEERFELGNQEYGSRYRTKDHKTLKKDIEEEILDIAVYAFMSYINLKHPNNK